MATLCCEEDVRPHRLLRAAVRRLLAFTEGFDLAVFGPTRVQSSAAMRSLGGGLPRRRRPPQGWSWLPGFFYSTHCVLWSPRGKLKAAGLLAGRLDIQIDSLFSVCHHAGLLRCLVQSSGPSLAFQGLHPSTVQRRWGIDCVLCHVPPSGVPFSGLAVLLMLAVGALIVAASVRYGRSQCRTPLGKLRRGGGQAEPAWRPHPGRATAL